jgi:chemotaxis protein MotB
MAGGGGGAWKVAYADFVTAMMALFMVLWISAQDKRILIATSHYFQSPFSSPMSDHSGVMPFNKESNSSSSPKSESDSAASKSSADKQVELSFLNSVAAEFFRLLNLEQNLDRKPIDIEVTSDGLRVTLFDRSRQPLFKEDGVEFTEWGIHLMQSMAWLIDRHHFHVTIDGHTREGLAMPRPDYSSWELSSDRANAARRKLVYYAVEPALIERVTGYADTKPLPQEDPKAESNQRITLSLALVHGDRDKDKNKLKTTAKAPMKSRAPAGEPQFALPNETGSSSPALKSESDVAASASLH